MHRGTRLVLNDITYLYAHMSSSNELENHRSVYSMSKNYANKAADVAKAAVGGVELSLKTNINRLIKFPPKLELESEQKVYENWDDTEQVTWKQTNSMPLSNSNPQPQINWMKCQFWEQINTCIMTDRLLLIFSVSHSSCLWLDNIEESSSENWQNKQKTFAHNS